MASMEEKKCKTQERKKGVTTTSQPPVCRFTNTPDPPQTIRARQRNWQRSWQSRQKTTNANSANSGQQRVGWKRADTCEGHLQANAHVKNNEKYHLHTLSYSTICVKSLRKIAECQSFETEKHRNRFQVFADQSCSPEFQHEQTFHFSGKKQPAHLAPPLSIFS